MKYCLCTLTVSPSFLISSLKWAVFAKGFGLVCWVSVFAGTASHIWLLLWVFSTREEKRPWIQLKAHGLPMLPYLIMLPYIWLFVCPHRDLFVQLSRTEPNWCCQLLSLKLQSVVTWKTGVFSVLQSVVMCRLGQWGIIHQLWYIVSWGLNNFKSHFTSYLKNMFL